MAIGLIAFLIIAFIIWCFYIRNDLAEMKNSSVLNQPLRQEAILRLSAQYSASNLPLLSIPKVIPKVDEIQIYKPIMLENCIIISNDGTLGNDVLDAVEDPIHVPRTPRNSMCSEKEEEKSNLKVVNSQPQPVEEVIIVDKIVHKPVPAKLPPILRQSTDSECNKSSSKLTDMPSSHSSRVHISTQRKEYSPPHSYNSHPSILKIRNSPTVLSSEGKRKKQRNSEDDRSNRNTLGAIVEVQHSENDLLNEVEIQRESSKGVSFNTEVVEGIFEADDDTSKPVWTPLSPPS